MKKASYPCHLRSVRTRFSRLVRARARVRRQRLTFKVVRSHA
jgi:hypothetical protein